ncbi:uncharacterized protein CC84DRAFT_1168497 [Paraphaeosphaeria sporulosa]|uniref:Secreted protein n=1 Tax=Paraphaeosphaeria sporulosa TaxID=1460663 RepID=A0A177C196_9PLEO|nr:uncharacterized protein CC84DRAFT_1168497 [Paraphaeosphaeria sporulosa]OAG00390.1 hypothetical protein CC84DRAFT_1168497 [Paraphaeosphaeria sporulosa]
MDSRTLQVVVLHAILVCRSQCISSIAGYCSGLKSIFQHLGKPVPSYYLPCIPPSLKYFTVVHPLQGYITRALVPPK